MCGNFVVGIGFVRCDIIFDDGIDFVYDVRDRIDDFCRVVDGVGYGDVF